MEQRILPKNKILSTFEIVENFHHFCKVRSCRFSVKNSIFRQLPKSLKKHFFWWVEQRILPKKILSTFEIVQNFHHFCKVPSCQFSIKNSIFQKLPKKFVETLLLLSEQRILPKNVFLAHFEIVQNFHHFCKVRGCRFSVKNSIFQKLPKSL